MVRKELEKMSNAVRFESRSREVLYSKIIDALDTMPGRLREVFVLKHYTGMSERAIARRTGIQLTELASAVWEANATFRRSLEPPS
jgi:DNA-directed RNA polymerase specialized sigma24 family protein